MALVCLALFVLLSIYDASNNVVTACETDGDCGKPDPPSHGTVKCSGGTWTAHCDPGYKFADGSNDVELQCSNGVWYVYGAPWSKKFSCEKESSSGRLGRSGKGDKGPASQKFCKEKLQDKRFQPCRELFNYTSLLIDACSWSFCYCELPNPEDCACDKIGSFVQAYCTVNGKPAVQHWRDQKFCPIHCDGGRVPTSCAPTNDATCGSPAIVDPDTCTDGCVCPKGTVIFNGTCIKDDQCRCSYNGKTYKNGEKIKQGCNDCNCNNGKWQCTRSVCPDGTCSAKGDPHYTTFDGKTYDFMGNCSYHLVEASDFNITVTHAHCDGYQLLPDRIPTCTKNVTITYEGHSIKLDQGPTVAVDGQPITVLPYSISGISIRKQSADTIIVELSNGVTIKWTNRFDIYVTVPPSYAGNTTGLCGNFNNDKNDDFKTPNGTNAKDEYEFGNSWRLDDTCPPTPQPRPPCDNNPNKPVAETECKKLKSDIFKECNKVVNPDSYYSDCLYDSCACGNNITECLCSRIRDYADACRARGIVIDWRKNFSQCPMSPPCTNGTRYQICASPCDRTCLDISAEGVCSSECVEDCRCPLGQTFDGSGNCIPINECGCPRNGTTYPDGREMIISGEFCTCTNAKWNCIKDPPCQPEGAVFRIDCNNCTCTNSKLVCTSDTCPNGCVVQNSDGQRTIVPPGDQWNDGCKRCTCNDDPKTGYTPVCVTPECPSPPSSDDFVYQNATNTGQCCPTYTVVACKYNGTTYNETQSWKISTCETGTCVRNGDGVLTKQETTQSCPATKCDEAYEFVPSNNTCCEKRVQVACVVEDGARKVNETWTSDDPCVTYSCAFIDGEFVINTHRETCSVENDCTAGSNGTDTCCNKCNSEVPPPETNSRSNNRHSKHLKSHSGHKTFHSKHSKHSEHSQHLEHSGRSKHFEHSKHSDRSKHAEHSKHSDRSKHAEHSKHSERSKHAEHSKHSKHSKHSEHAKET